VLRINSKSGNHDVVSPGEEKERLQWEGFTEKEDFADFLSSALNGSTAPRVVQHSNSGKKVSIRFSLPNRFFSIRFDYTINKQEKLHDNY